MWAERELDDPVYDIAEPTIFDRVARAVADFFGRLFGGQLPSEWGPALALIAAVVLCVVIVAAFLVWGVPRATGRVRERGRALFGEDETRSADELRRDAASHAERRDWDAAIVLRFRALARGTAERGIVEPPPGATVHSFARAAGRAFPALADELERAATSFDDVRYLRRPGTAALYEHVARVDEAIVRSAPAPQPEAVPA